MRRGVLHSRAVVSRGKNTFAACGERDAETGKSCTSRYFLCGKDDVICGNLFCPGAGAQKLYAIGITIAHKKDVLLAKIVHIGADTALRVLGVSLSWNLQTEVSIVL